MSTDRYSVFRIPQSLFDEIVDIDKSSKHSLIIWLREHTKQLLWLNLDDRFRKYDDAESFATMVYHQDNSGDIVAIYDLLNNEWMSGWFL